MATLDSRAHAYRKDLADQALQGQVEAARFVEGRPAVLRRGVADLRRKPSETAGLDSQLLFGEALRCFEERDGWAWVQSATDGYVGYVRADDLAFGAQETASHRVAVLATHLYPEPDLKAPALDGLTLGARVAVRAERNGFSEVAGGWAVSRHLWPLERREPDYVQTALAFLGLPYLWGGRSSFGLDCSALVQLALDQAGIPCMRDSDQQAASIGAAVAEGAPRRGDLIYMPGHVVIALDETQVVNANAHHMMVSVEPLADVVGRVAEESGRPPEQAIDVIRRL